MDLDPPNFAFCNRSSQTCDYHPASGSNQILVPGSTSFIFLISSARSRSGCDDELQEPLLLEPPAFQGGGVVDYDGGNG